MSTCKFAKRIVCLVLVCATFLSLCVPAFASNSNVIPEPALDGEYVLTYEESFLSDDNHSIRIVLGKDVDTESTNTCSIAYVDGQLNSISYQYPDADKIVEYNYSSTQNAASGISTANNIGIKEYKLSDYVVDVPVVESSEYVEETSTSVEAAASDAPWPRFYEDDGWVFSRKIKAVPSYPYDVYSYYKNYDEEPYNHPFMKKEVHILDGMLVSTVSSIFSSYLESFINKTPLTLKAFLISLGVAIVVDAGISIVRGEFIGTTFCSTQRILYAPVVEGYIIYSNAYLERLWLIAEDDDGDYQAVELLDDMYDSSPIQFASEEDLMYNARHWFTDWAISSGYDG